MMSAPDPRRLSLNQATTEKWGMAQTIDGCARAGVGWIGLWRHKVAEIGVAETARRVRAAGLEVSSLCRGGVLAKGRFELADRRTTVQGVARRRGDGRGRHRVAMF